MKITKRQLKRIIKEERAKLNEQPSSVGSGDEMTKALHELEASIIEFSKNVDGWFMEHNDLLEPTGMLDDSDSWAIRLEEMRYDLNELVKEALGGGRRVR